MSTTAPDTPWSQSYPYGSRIFHAFERPERGGTVYVKFFDPTRRGRDRRRKVRLGAGFTVRDKNGLVDARLCRAVDQAVEELANDVSGGRLEANDAEPASLSLYEGFDHALDCDRGKYPTKTRNWQTVKAASTEVQSILGMNSKWSEIKPRDVKQIWRTYAKRAAKLPFAERLTGLRKAEVLVDAFYSVAAWLEEDGMLEAGDVVPIKKWRKKLKDEWTTTTGAEPIVQRPRHSGDDWERLFATLAHPDLDPRFRLAFDLGAEQRLGQVLRCRRSQLSLPIVDADRGRTGSVGELRVSGAGRKRASTIALTVAQRALVESALTGYLAFYEQRYREDPNADYPLFPAGRLKCGRAKLRTDQEPLTRDAARNMFNELERLAGVAHRRGRGWNGIRRIATDLAEDETNDERVLNQLTGHRDSSTRQLIYQDQARPEVLKHAAELREKLRRPKPQGTAAQNESAATDASA